MEGMATRPATRRSLILGALGLLLAGCSQPALDEPLPTEAPLPTDTPTATATPTPRPTPTWTPVPTATPEPYAADWQNITPPISLTANDPVNNYGAQTLVMDPQQPSTLYLGTCYQGLWKTTDGGGHWVKINTGRNAWALDGGRVWALAIDPADPRVLYATSGFGAGGVWKTTDGGVNWEGVLPQEIQQRYSGDVLSISVCPQDPSHLLIGFRTTFKSLETAGLMRSTDAGATWRVLGTDVPWLSAHVAFFLTPTTFLVTTTFRGFWRSADAGQTWRQVSTFNIEDGGNQLYTASDGTIYSGGQYALLVSADQGLTWRRVQPIPLDKDGYYAVAGAGGYLFTAVANAGTTLSGPTTYFVSPESDGRRWRRQSRQQFADGPRSMVVDQASRTIYSANWNSGVWKLTLSA